ncbi:MAG: hypothetical protein QOD77_1283 [Thermoplasmata archaeon]|jgi:hypothetical protein|nr:hypothetical protein [Thermoplasmata archaeon]
MDRTPTLLLGCFTAFATLLAIPVATAQDAGAECDVHTELLADIQYYLDGGLVASGTALQGNVQTGGNLTAQVTVAEGCEAQVALVAYDVDAASDVAAAVSVDAQLLGEGTHNLTVAVPDCLFEVTLVAGAVLEAATSPEVLYQAEGRLIAFATGGLDCTVQVLPDLPCPGNVVVSAQADGTVLLEFLGAIDGDLGLDLDATATTETAALAVLRATPGGAFETIATVSTGTTSYLDTTAAEGEVYLYAVVLVQGDLVLTLDCPVNEVTTIPDLPTGIAVGAAGILGTGAYALLRRRKA